LEATVAAARSALRCLGAIAVLAAPAAVAQALSQTTITSVAVANALSTPAARHLVRTTSGTYLLALQRDNATPDTGLNLYRSDDDGRSWAFYAAINPAASERHTADIVRLGDDLAMVTSFDAPSIVADPGLDPARKVYFQWWRADGARDWSPGMRVAVFNPSPGVAYHRGELALDSRGRIWVQAFKRGAAWCDPASDPKCAVCAATNGDNYANEVVVSVSTDGGRTFAPERSLATTRCRAGGRLISVGTKLLLVWNDYSGNEHGTRIVTRFVERNSDDPLSAWTAPRDAFPDEPADGIYHGAAMSAVADGTGVHVVYKDQNKLQLWYRRFDAATSTFGARVQIDDSLQDWALQPATTLRNGELFVFANHRLAEGRYETRMWRQSVGLGVAHATALPAEDAFHGYPTLPETLPADVRTVPYVYARAPTASGGGNAIALRVALDGPIAILSLEAGRALLPAGRSIGIRVQTAPVPGLTDPLRLEITGLPAGVRAEFAPTQVPAGETAMLTLAADATAPAASATCVLGLMHGAGGTTMDFRLDVLAAPAVSLQGLTSGATLSGVARIEVTADASPGIKVAEVRLLVNGAVSATASGSPATFSWDTSAVPDGAHDLSATAVDEIGNSTTSAPVRVAVRNGGGGGCASAQEEQPLMALAAALAGVLRRRNQKPRRRALKMAA
jgi:hypothetical protein